MACDGGCSPKDASFAGGILRDDPLLNLYEKWLENVSFKFINVCDMETAL
jgi:hypothetical protein